MNEEMGHDWDGIGIHCGDARQSRSQTTEDTTDRQTDEMDVKVCHK